MKKFFIGIIIGIIFIFGTPAFSVQATIQFTDINEKNLNKESYEAVISLVSDGIIGGYKDGRFGPNDSVTRGQAAKIIGEAIGIDINQKGKQIFSDVNEKTDHYRYINALANEGIFSKADKFNPYKKLNRQQMAKILVEAFNLKGETDINFKDMKKGNDMYPYVQTLVANGITTGKTKNTFNPYDKVTRLQMVLFIQRTLKHLEVGQVKDKTEEKSDARLDDVIKYTNKERKKHGLPALKKHVRLEETAMIKAEDLYINNYWAHESPVHGGVGDMLTKAKIKWTRAGENLAMGYSDPEGVVTAWMESPGHRKNILDDQFTHIGVGYFEEGKKKFFVQMFIRDKW